MRHIHSAKARALDSIARKRRVAMQNNQLHPQSCDKELERLEQWEANIKARHRTRR